MRLGARWNYRAISLEQLLAPTVPVLTGIVLPRFDHTGPSGLREGRGILGCLRHLTNADRVQDVRAEPVRCGSTHVQHVVVLDDRRVTRLGRCSRCGHNLLLRWQCRQDDLRNRRACSEIVAVAKMPTQRWPGHRLGHLSRRSRLVANSDFGVLGKGDSCGRRAVRRCLAADDHRGNPTPTCIHDITGSRPHERRIPVTCHQNCRSQTPRAGNRCEWWIGDGQDHGLHVRVTRVRPTQVSVAQPLPVRWN